MTLRRLSAALLLFLLNLWIAWRLLFVAYLDQMGSIEATHIALGRWVIENFRDLTWLPLWYGGIPFQNAYPPLHPFLVAAAAAISGAAPALAYHVLTAVFYSLGPVILYFLALRFSGSMGYSLASGLFYSLFSPSAFLIPVVRYDMGSPWFARRLQCLVQYGEGPHIAAMTLIPLAVLLLDLAVEKRRPVWWLLAAFGLASVVLMNWLGASALMAAVIAWLLSRQRGAWRTNWLAALAVGMFAYLLSAAWIPPSTVLNIRDHEKYVSGSLPPGEWAWAIALLAVAAILLWIFRRFHAPDLLRFAILFLFPLAAVTLLSEWAGINLLPQAKRYHLEMEMGIALLLPFAARPLLQWTSRRTRSALVAVMILALIYPVLKYRRYARQLIRPIPIQNTIEYREAKWFERNAGTSRVFAAGSIRFSLNVFTSVPLFGGGFDQGVINPVYPAADYQILSGMNAGEKEGEVAVLWLKAFGVDAVSVSGPRGKEYYKPFRNPRKFDGLLPELWRDGDDVIYDVGRRSRSLAHVIGPADLPSRQPENGLDLDPVRPYVAALDNQAYPIARMKWRNNHAAVIVATMRRDQILSVQISYHPGWHARVDGLPRRLYGDHLGQVVIEPACEGPCDVDIYYDGGVEMLLARMASWGALLGGVCWILLDWLRRRPAR